MKQIIMTKDALNCWATEFLNQAKTEKQFSCQVCGNWFQAPFTLLKDDATQLEKQRIESKGRFDVRGFCSILGIGII